MISKPPSEWKDIVTLIGDAAARDGVPQWRIEATFQVGDGSGRVWRSWRSGKRSPSPERRASVINSAIRAGWLPPLTQTTLTPKMKKAKAAPPQKKRKKERSTWALMIYLITTAARHESPISPAGLERLLDIGSGNGRVWRSWLNGERLADSLTRENIERTAIERGWLKLSRTQQLEAETLPDEIVYAFPCATRFPITDLPDPPDKDTRYPTYCARAAANALVDDACGCHDEWREQAMRPLNVNRWSDKARKVIAQEINTERINAGRRWKAAVEEIRDADRKKLIDLGDRSSCRKLRAQLTAGYRLQGYK